MAVSRDVGFALERFGWTSADRLELAGRWHGLRGRRLARPVLVLHGDGQRRRLVAILDEDVAAGPSEDGEWAVAFPWTGDSFRVERAELDVGRNLVVELPPPERGVAAEPAPSAVPTARELTPRRFVPAARAQEDALGATTTPSAGADGASADPVELRAQVQAARAEAAAVAQAAEAAEARLRRQLHAAAGENERLRSDVARVREAGTGARELDARRAEIEAAQAELEHGGADLAAARAELEVRRTEVEAARADLDRRGAEVEAARRELRDHQAEVESARGELARRGAELEAARGALEREREAVEAERAALERWRSDTETRAAELARQRAELDAQRAQLAGATARAGAGDGSDASAQDAEEWRAVAQGLREELEAARRALAAARSQDGASSGNGSVRAPGSAVVLEAPGDGTKGERPAATAGSRAAWSPVAAHPVPADATTSPIAPAAPSGDSIRQRAGAGEPDESEPLSAARDASTAPLRSPRPVRPAVAQPVVAPAGGPARWAVRFIALVLVAILLLALVLLLNAFL